MGENIGKSFLQEGTRIQNAKELSKRQITQVFKQTKDLKRKFPKENKGGQQARDDTQHHRSLGKCKFKPQ